MTLDDLSRRETIASRARRAACPYCGSERTERTAEFGPFHMTEQFHCLACKSPFSKMRLESGGEEGRGGSEGS
jgi:ring-1,2-phenylacetyl-CoA epoxidase subunit PaaD